MASQVLFNEASRFNEANPDWQRNNPLAVEQRKNANLAAQERQRQQQQLQLQLQQQHPRDIGSTSLHIATDNRIKFKVDASLTTPYEFEVVQNVKPNAKVPITEFNFYYIRHAKSCANEQTGLSGALKKLNLDDPFISNDGIFATLSKRAEYEKFFGKRNIHHYFCTPLGRTMFTAKMLFPNQISNFQIAPHLREDESGYTNNPYPYDTTMKRCGFVSEYVNVLTDGAVKIGDGVPGYALMHKAFTNYGSDFVDQNGIELFMQWYIKNENILGRTNSQIRNVVVVCHSDILKTFCKAHLDESQLAARGMGGGDAFFKHTNNYCIQVQVVMPVRQSMPVQHGRPLTSSESEEVKLLVAKNLEQQTAETEALKIAELTQAEAVAKLQSGNTTQMIQSAGGNKRKKTKRVKRTKSTKRQNKKTRVVKQRGGGEGADYVYAEDAPPPTYLMTITKAIDGTKDIARDPRAKIKDCICEPDAYQNPVKTFECAKQGQDDSRGFALRQNPKNKDEMKINEATAAEINANALKSKVLQKLTQAT